MNIQPQVYTCPYHGEFVWLTISKPYCETCGYPMTRTDTSESSRALAHLARLESELKELKKGLQISEAKKLHDTLKAQLKGTR